MPKKKNIRAGAGELERLREENEYLKAEVAYLKKLKALDQEESAEMFGIGPRSFTNWAVNTLSSISWRQADYPARHTITISVKSPTATPMNAAG